MAIPTHKQLANALTHAHEVARQHIIQSAHLTEQERKTLITHGFLKKIIRGWYLLDADHVAQSTGESVLWQESYRAFLGQYLASCFDADYHLSPEDSLDIHTGVPTQPTNLLVYVKEDTRRHQPFPGGLVLQTLQRTAKYASCQPIEMKGLWVLPLPDALMLVGPQWFRKNPLEAELALSMVDVQALARSALRIANMEAAKRIIGAYQFMGALDRADYLKNILEQAGFEQIRSDIKNPFQDATRYFNHNHLPKSPYAGRIHALWQSMRAQIIDIFPAVQPRKSIDDILLKMDDLYVHDAYHSLSIEGYRVTPELIAKIGAGEWLPLDRQDKEQIDALAAKGYSQAFKEVKNTVIHLYENNHNTLLPMMMSRWYSALFGPCVQAGIVRAEDIAGYRNRPVYIRGSKHVPLPYDAMRDAMEALFTELAQESSPAVCAVMGHFLLGYIHPYPDGNGRMARFLMNTLFSVSGYPWTIVRVEERQAYMECLEKASCGGDIRPFARFILQAMKHPF